MAKKQFFQDLSKGEIKGKDLVEVTGFMGVQGLGDEEYAVVPEFVPRGFESARKFMKHGREVKLRRMYTVEQASKYGKTPVQMREDAFNFMKGHNYCGYSFMPIGKDSRKRKVNLVECLEGARIFAYANPNQGLSSIKVKHYSDAKRVRREGAEVVMEVPSRTKGERRMQFKMINVPFVDSFEKFAIAQNLGSDHSCGSKRFNIRYRYSDDKECSGIVNVCAHEIAGYHQLVQDVWDEDKNIVPLQMSQFAIPTQETVDYYLKWENNVLVKDESLKVKDKLRKPNRAEKEIALWALVEGWGHDRTFFAKQSRDGSLQNYDWGV
jgi:hypothetical protein